MNNLLENMSDNQSIIYKGNKRRSSIFNIYSKVFKVMLANLKINSGKSEEDEHIRELDDLVLPSNEDWRHQVYYRLVELQREIDSTVPIKNDELADDQLEETKGKKPAKNQWNWKPKFPEEIKDSEYKQCKLFQNSISKSSSMTDAVVEPGWHLRDIILAAKVLEGKSTEELVYSDEAEMRRVFGLVYDVLRYKYILNQTVENAGFWKKYKNLYERKKIVWLLLFDMQGRKFPRNNTPLGTMEIRKAAFEAAGLNDIEEALESTKTKLAASASRLRINGTALTLDELLPKHMRRKGVCWSNEESTACGWVNTIKVPTKNDFIMEMKKLNLELIESDEFIGEYNYTFDSICPKVVIFHEKAREYLATSDLVLNHKFIFLDKAVCLGAAMLGYTIRTGHLCGPVILTHPIAPRHAGYLAGLLIDIDEIERLLVFGTNRKRQDYIAYLDRLGITEQHCRIFSENYIEAPGFTEMERTTVILATPPSSYTGLCDVVDLVVARDGDIELLEILTNLDEKTQLEKSKEFLAEQISCLKFALKKPNVQLLMYQAFSTLPSETTEMLNEAIDYANKLAIEKHTRDAMPKKKGGKEVTPRKSCKTEASEVEMKTVDGEAEDNDVINVPESDLFQFSNIFDFNSKDSNEFIMKDGCFLSIVRRKEMMQFNSLFMIKVAESKGLFGDPNNCNKIPVESKEMLKDQMKNLSGSGGKKKKNNIHLDKITAPTHSSMIKSGNNVNESSSGLDLSNDDSTNTSIISNKTLCPRYCNRVERSECEIKRQIRETRRNDVKLWWEQSANFLIHAAHCESCKFRIFYTDPSTKRVRYPSTIQKLTFNGVAYR